MGRPKAALCLSDRADTFVARLIRTFQAAAIPDIVVITGAQPDAVRAAAGRVGRKVRFIDNPHWERDGQLSSLLAALKEDQQLEALMMTLVDAPFVAPATVSALVHAWRSSRAAIVRPSRGDEHGHPVIFDRAVFEELRHADPSVGAKAVVRARQADILNVPVDDRGAFIDVDTPEEYRAAVTLYGGRK